MSKGYLSAGGILRARRRFRPATAENTPQLVDRNDFDAGLSTRAGPNCWQPGLLLRKSSKKA
jgi:hypothetical protein